MNNGIFVKYNTEETFELELDYKNVTNVEKVCLVIETNDMSISLPCSLIEDKKWECKIPKMDFLEVTTYNYHLEFIADGYYFEPYNGIFTIQRSPEIYTTEPKNKKLTANKPKTVFEDDKEKVAKKTTKKPIRETKRRNKILTNYNDDLDIDIEKDQKIKNILRSINR